MTEIAARFIPVFLIIAIGSIFRSKGILSGPIVEGLKKLIINLGLPAVLFLSFLTMELKSRYLLLFAAVFLLCLLLFLAGKGLKRLSLVTVPLAPFFFTGFEFGMVGVALFSSLFGLENLHYILLLGLGHEIFIWFVYAPLLEAENHGQIHLGRIFRSFLSSPIILAIISALILNLSGVYAQIQNFFVVSGVVSALDTVSRITTPLILLAIGFQLKLTAMNWRESIRLLSWRLGLVAVGSFVLYFLTDLLIMELDRMMTYAFITFLLLPPPFIIPVFLGEKLQKESEFYNNLLVLYTIITLIVYAAVMMAIGA
jgi:malate permease and related proteins